MLIQIPNNSIPNCCSQVTYFTPNFYTYLIFGVLLKKVNFYIESINFPTVLLIQIWSHSPWNLLVRLLWSFLFKFAQANIALTGFVTCKNGVDVTSPRDNSQLSGKDVTSAIGTTVNWLGRKLLLIETTVNWVGRMLLLLETSVNWVGRMLPCRRQQSTEWEGCYSCRRKQSTD